MRGIAGMVEDDRYCIDVLQQISAAQAALDKVALALVNEHTRHCVLGAAPENQEEKRAELMTALTRLVGPAIAGRPARAGGGAGRIRRRTAGGSARGPARSRARGSSAAPS